MKTGDRRRQPSLCSLFKVSDMAVSTQKEGRENNRWPPRVCCRHAKALAPDMGAGSAHCVCPSATLSAATPPLFEAESRTLLSCHPKQLGDANPSTSVSSHIRRKAFRALQFPFEALRGHPPRWVGSLAVVTLCMALRVRYVSMY